MADEELVLVDEEDCLVDDDDLVADEVAFLVLSVVGSMTEEDDLLDDRVETIDDDFDDDAADDDLEMLLDLAELVVFVEEREADEPEETIVAACCELKTETIDEATDEVLTEDVEDWLLLADLSCGLAE
ncbi:hypothetical protein M436DRAFT_80657 [Aureobasidium namibiae CBS 147.97]|uniref:Uncharacterized protein n=1 Tax=Aureobasidium namibiae CBS 147.97 TaxID=1043004 RepID=A0A074WM78_9PEZI|nr:uncharacterized protein M436DRAFT_80657 [Aureobasidium namibiae CBS 147.97]KEQ74210.1 hypothetical protein M436DRAFT_80657 [Aureobasidium namibiae CBS 147.97]